MTTMEALASNELPAIFVYDTISATPLRRRDDPSPPTTSFMFNNAAATATSFMFNNVAAAAAAATMNSPAVPVAEPQRRKRRWRTKSVKNKEEAETQRRNHIAVERNRRRLMNDHLGILRSLMPESYIQRGDQASIVGGAIDYVRELEQLLQSLEAQKRASQQHKGGNGEKESRIEHADSSSGSIIGSTDAPPFAEFFVYPQYLWRHAPREHPTPTDHHGLPAVADIEVTLVETHANLRILTPRRPRQLLKMVSGLQVLRLTILHLTVTTLDSMVLYSLSARVEEGCSLTTVDDIAAAVHRVLVLVEAETPAAQNR